MFTILVSADGEAWEGNGVMSMHAYRFTEFSGDEGAGIASNDRASLRRLNGTMAILMYEEGGEAENTDVVRIGVLEDVRPHNGTVCFRFTEWGRVDRRDIYEFAAELSLERNEKHRTHWALKDGAIPPELIARAVRNPREQTVGTRPDHRIDRNRPADPGDVAPRITPPRVADAPGASDAPAALDSGHPPTTTPPVATHPHPSKLRRGIAMGNAFVKHPVMSTVVGGIILGLIAWGVYSFAGLNLTDPSTNKFQSTTKP